MLLILAYLFKGQIWFKPTISSDGERKCWIMKYKNWCVLFFLDFIFLHQCNMYRYWYLLIKVTCRLQNSNWGVVYYLCFIIIIWSVFRWLGWIICYLHWASKVPPEMLSVGIKWSNHLGRVLKLYDSHCLRICSLIQNSYKDVLCNVFDKNSMKLYKRNEINTSFQKIKVQSQNEVFYKSLLSTFLIYFIRVVQKWELETLRHGSFMILWIGLRW